MRNFYLLKHSIHRKRSLIRLHRRKSDGEEGNGTIHSTFDFQIGRRNMSIHVYLLHSYALEPKCQWKLVEHAHRGWTNERESRITTTHLFYTEFSFGFVIQFVVVRVLLSHTCYSYTHSIFVCLGVVAAGCPWCGFRCHWRTHRMQTWFRLWNAIEIWLCLRCDCEFPCWKCWAFIVGLTLTLKSSGI